MLKYYVFLFLIVGIALFYVFIKDPCNQQLKTDFSDKYPSYEIVGSGASEGSPESVRCHISYRKPDSEEIYEDLWLYLKSRSGWKFSKIIETRQQDQSDGTDEAPPRNGDPEASTGGAELLHPSDRGSQYASHAYSKQFDRSRVQRI